MFPQLISTRQYDERLSQLNGIHDDTNACMGHDDGRITQGVLKPIPGHGLEVGEESRLIATAANLTPHNGTGLGSWDEADFMRVFREGVGPDGMPVDSSMPWFALDAMSDEELSALWMFLQTVEPIENAPAEQ